jgi:hypothetical protein
MAAPVLRPHLATHLTNRGCLLFASAPWRVFTSAHTTGRSRFGALQEEKMKTGTAIMVLALIMGAWLTALERVTAAAPKPQQVTVANMHIDPAAGHTILPDAVGPTYIDYRLSAGDSCVQGEIYPVGLASLVLNRRVDEAGNRCSDVGGTPRAFRIVLNHEDACLRLLNQSAPCTHVTPAGMPHVRGETAFKSKNGKTAMTFYFITQDPHINWRLTTDVDADLASLSANTKIVTYSGKMTLAEHQGNPGGYVPVSFGIPMSFQITFDRVTVTP